jgi:VWFA-related protein
MARTLQSFWEKAFEKATGNRQDFVEEGNRTMKFLPLSGILLLTFGLGFATPALRAREARPAPAAKAAGNNSPFGDVIEVNVVNVDVTATDDKGRPVTGLRKGDFELLEDGKAVAVSNFETVTAAASGAQAAVGAASPASPPSPDDALNLVVFFDNFNLRPPHRARVLRQLHEFLARQLGPGDRVMVVSYDGGLHVRVPFTGDPAAIAAGLKTLETLVTHGDESDRDRRGAFDAMMAIQRNALLDPDPIPCPMNIVTPAEAYASSRRHEVLQAVGALTLLVNSLSGVPGRKAVLHVSDGLPLQPGEEAFQYLVELCGGNGTSGFGSNSPSRPVPTSSGPLARGGGSGAGSGGGSAGDPDAPQVYDAASLDARSYQAASQAPLDAQRYSVAKNLETLAAHANAHRVTLYTLQASGAETTEASDASYAPNERFYQFQSVGTAERANRRDSLSLLADATGGRAILDANDTLPDLTRMRADLASFYSLGFTPPHASDGREHHLEVKVKTAGVHLRYRQSYRDKTTLEKVMDRTLAALFYGIDDNPLDLTIEIGEPVAEGNQYSVPVQLKIPLFKLAILNQRDDSSFKGKLRILVATRDEQGGTSPVRQVEVPLDIPRKEVLNALGQYYLYTLTLKMKGGPQHIAVAVRDELAATSSYLSRPLTVGPGAVSASSHP